MVGLAAPLVPAPASPAGTLAQETPYTHITTRGTAAHPVKRVAVEVSFDDGKTWKQVRVAGDRAIVHHPKDAKFASLRAKTTDASGNTGEVTIIRAYRIAS